MGAFSIFDDKRSKHNKSETPSVNDHYSKLARRAMLVRYVCLIFVVVFTVYSLSFHSKEITIDNFEYMIKFLNQGEEAVAPKNSKLSFDGTKGNVASIFKGDLAILNGSGLTVTGWDGDIILKENFSYDYPKITENGINLFCYDLGGKELKIFNSYSKLATISFDYPIYGFSPSKSGGFAVLSSAKGYRTAAYIYDKEYRQIYSCYFGNKYADFIALSPNGDEFIIAAHYSKGGNIVTVVSRYRTDSAENEPLFSQTFVGEIPLGVYYNDEGFCLMTSDALRMYRNDEVACEVSFSGKELLTGEIYGNRTVLTYRLEGLSGGTETVVYRNDGSNEFSYEFSTSISDSLVCGEYLYVLSPGELSICELSSGAVTTYSVPTSYATLVKDDERVVLFSENQAEYFDNTTFSKTEVSQ